jgi:hypothetical protein
LLQLFFGFSFHAKRRCGCWGTEWRRIIEGIGEKGGIKATSGRDGRGNWRIELACCWGMIIKRGEWNGPIESYGAKKRTNTSKHTHTW